MSLSQTQIIRSLGEALAWLEKELSWGAQIAELRHLTGRIGELYAAMVTRGQMAISVNQHGYDVVSAEGHRISVKTITSSSKISFNPNTISQATHVMILQIEFDENEPSIRELFHRPVADLAPILKINGTDCYLPTAALIRPASGQPVNLTELKVVASAVWKEHTIIQLENGTIQVLQAGEPLLQAKPTLRLIAREVGVDIMNSMENPKNTRSLGSDIIKAIGQRVPTGDGSN